ncbi:MAG: acyl-CoA dehydrogenase family protein, partial [Thermoanaerobaculia bacterium]
MAENNGSILSEELLLRCRERAPVYDLENRFCQEDFDELKEAGYLKIAVPKEMGGHGMSLAEVAMETRRLAYYAPATALAINMHIYWTGVAADIRKSGDDSLNFILEEAAAGEVFAAGHSESGNTVPVLLSTTKAEKVDGGYKFTGKKGFGSLSPVWTRLGLHGMDASDPENPKIIHGFLPRDAEGYTIKETWDVLGMRATRSDDTILDGALVPDHYIGRIVPAGAAGVDLFVLGIFAWALIGFANVYYALANRVAELTFEQLKKKTGPGLTRTMAYHPEVQHGVAEMVLALEGMGPQLDKVAQDWSEGVDHGPAWVIKIVGTKYNVVEAAWRVVDTAMDVSGGYGMFKKNEVERLYRDCRAGRFHPASSALTHELVA